MKRGHGLAALSAVALGLALVGCGGGNSSSNNNGGGGLQGQRIFAVTSGNQLISFGTGNSNVTQSNVAITGLQGGETVLGIDTRPANSSVVLLGSSNRLYNLNTTTGVATAIGGVFTPALRGASFGFDFNPTVDRIRIVSDTNQNLRANPDTGAIVDANPNAAGVQEDGALAYIQGDPAQGQNPDIVAVGYQNSVANAQTTKLFGIDSARNTLVSFDSANGGTLRTVGALGVDVSNIASFDIQGGNDDALAVFRVGAENALYRINLTTGAATRLSNVGNGSTNIVAAAVAAN